MAKGPFALSLRRDEWQGRFLSADYEINHKFNQFFTDNRQINSALGIFFSKNDAAIKYKYEFLYCLEKS